MSRNLSWKGTGQSKDQKCVCSDNTGENIRNKIK